MPKTPQHDINRENKNAPPCSSNSANSKSCNTKSCDTKPCDTKSCDTEKHITRLRVLRDFFAAETQKDIEQVFSTYKNQNIFSAIHACSGEDVDCSSIDWVNVDWLNVEYDFNRLFIGPDKVVAPLFASVYLEANALLMGDYTVRMRQLMEELDLGVPTLINGGSIPEDFLAYELDILIILNTLIIQNQNDSKNIELCTALTTERDWLNEHLKAWIPLFIEKCEEDKKNNPIEKPIACILALLAECFKK